jgi:prephenate dehydrogenase
MRVGILGSGLMGGKLGTLFARAGHEVVFSYARTRRSWRDSRGMPGKTRGREHRLRQPAKRTPSYWPCTGREWTMF